MLKPVEKVWGWLCSKEPIRHFLCIFFWGFDLKRYGNNARQCKDMALCEAYRKNPVGADPKLREFVTWYEKSRDRDDLIKWFRSFCDMVVCVSAIGLLFAFAQWLDKMIYMLF